MYRCAADELDATIIELNTLTVKNVKEEYRRQNVTISKTSLYAVGGHVVPFGKFTFPADLECKRAAIGLVKLLNPKIKDGEIHHIPVKIYKKGLYDIPQLLDDIRNNKNYGKKLVAVLN